MTSDDAETIARDIVWESRGEWSSATVDPPGFDFEPLAELIKSAVLDAYQEGVDSEAGGLGAPIWPRESPKQDAEEITGEESKPGE